MNKCIFINRTGVVSYTYRQISGTILLLQIWPDTWPALFSQNRRLAFVCAIKMIYFFKVCILHCPLLHQTCHWKQQSSQKIENIANINLDILVKMYGVLHDLSNIEWPLGVGLNTTLFLLKQASHIYALENIRNSEKENFNCQWNKFQEQKSIFLAKYYLWDS